MNISESLRNHTKAISSANISEDIFKKLLENCFSILTKNQELHNISTLYNSKPDVIKNAHATLLTICAEFARNNQNKESIKSFLLNECNYSQNRTNLFVDLYEKNKLELQIILGSIGSHLPHVTDVKWKIDYIVKSNNLDQADGPLFRISLVTDAYDDGSGSKKTEAINFTCNSQELQDLVYKLKDAVRHCQRLTMD